MDIIYIYIHIDIYIYIYVCISISISTSISIVYIYIDIHTDLPWYPPVNPPGSPALVEIHASRALRHAARRGLRESFRGRSRPTR